MSAGRHRVLVVASHPVQYAAPQFRRMAQHPNLEVQVAYCSLQGAEPYVDRGFGVRMAWDTPLLDGYPWVHVRTFLGLVNPGLWTVIRAGRFDAVVLLTGYRCVSFWIAAAAARTSGTAMLFGTDAHEARSRDSDSCKAMLKTWLWPVIFRLADVVIVPSSGSVALMRSLGVAHERIELTPYVVDNEWWTAQAARVDVARVRGEWNIPGDAAVLLFCAKLQPWKRPGDLLEAFAAANAPGSYLVFAGDGPLRHDLERRANDLGLAERVRFLGFVNQSGLATVYRACDVLVLPSEHEPFGVVVNEAMLCGLPAIVSDRVGARHDLVREGQTGFVFPCRDVAALARVIGAALSDVRNLRRMGAAARERMKSWSPRDNLDGVVCAIERAIELRGTRR